jgi:hypothetical protein
MKKPIVVGLVAPKQAGKTTVTNMLAEFVNIKESAFADKLKNACAKAFNIPRNHFDDQNLKEVPFETPIDMSLDRIKVIMNEYGAQTNSQTVKGSLVGMQMKSPRHIAQIVGTELLRDGVSKTIHIDNVIIYPDAVTVISDTRFENEYEVMNQRSDIDYYAAYVFRKQAEEVAKTSDHASETEFFKFKDKCYIIDNNGSLRDLELNVKRFLDKVMFENKGSKNG